MPRLIPSLALTAAVVMSNAALEPRASAQVQEAHGVYHTQFENDWVRVVRVRYPANSQVLLHVQPHAVVGASPIELPRIDVLTAPHSERP